MKQTEKKYFGAADAGLDSDSAAFSLPANAWTNMENCRTLSTDTGEVGGVESVGGATEKATMVGGSIHNGAIPDYPNSRIIFFNFQATSKGIYVYYPQTGTTYTALLDYQVTGGLGISEDIFIHNGKVVNGLLYYTDNNSAPRKFNIDAAIKLNHPAFVTTQAAYTLPIDDTVLSLAKRPLGIPVFWAKSTNASVVVNRIQDFAGQFATRLIYRDGEESVLSIPSELVNYNKKGQTQNQVEIYFNTAEKIHQDVATLDLCVRYGNSGNYFIIKSWDISDATEAAEIAAHNAGTTPLQYIFYNTQTGIPLSIGYSIKPNDRVPLKSKTLEVANDRLFLANNLLGYNTPKKTSLAFTTSAVALSDFALKSASAYRLGIQFRDKYKRKSGVITNSTLFVRTPTRTQIDSPFVPGYGWSLSNTAAADEIPDWAYYYDIVMTKSLTTRFFLQGFSLQYKYFTRDSDGKVIPTSVYDASKVEGIMLDIRLLKSYNMGYSYQEGDRCRLITSTAAYELTVTGQEGDFIYLTPTNTGTLSPLFNFCTFELYTPYGESENEPYYTLGRSYYVVNPTASNRQYSAVSGFIDGDVAIIQRHAASYFECMSPNDNYWKDWFSNTGEPNFVTDLGQVHNKHSVLWSNVYIAGTRTNGLSSFDALDEKILPQEAGQIQKLQITSKVQDELGIVMLAICEKETLSLYLGEVQQYGSNQQSTLVSAPNIIGSVNALKGSYGTVNPESILEHRGNVYWLDANNGRWIQYSSNGLFPISDYRMTRFWKEWAKQYLSMTSAQIKALGGRPFIFTGIDTHHNELLISIPKLSNTPPKGYLTDYPQTIYPFDIHDFQGKTIVYKLGNGEGKPHFQGAYTFYAEGFASMNNKLFSFKAGSLWEHNGTNDCNFYGTQYKSRIMFVSNMMPSVPKIYDSIAVEANMKPTLTYLLTNYPYLQISDLVDTDYKDLEGQFYAVFYRNKIQLTSGGSNNNGLLTGEKMRAVAMRFLLEFTITTIPLELKFVNINFTISSGHTNI